MEKNLITGKWYGEDHELAVATVLVCAVNEGILTEKDLWNMVKIYKPQNFSGLVNLIVVELESRIETGEYSIEDMNAFWEILENQNMAAKELTFLNKNSSYTPSFQWQKPIKNTNTKSNFEYEYIYNLVIKGIDTEYEYVSSDIKGTSYAVPYELWKEVLKECPNGFFWTIRTKENHTPRTSGYYSQINRIDYQLGNMTISSSERCREQRVYMSAGEFCDYEISFQTSGNKVIQTFGQLDTVLELYSADGALLKGRSSTDDLGYSRNALISYNFSAGTKYILRVKFYSTNTTGYTKIVIVPTYHHSEFEDAYGPYGITKVSWSLSTDRVALFRYQFSSSGDVTFTMSSSTNTDTYLYIIDPGSTELTTLYLGNNEEEANLRNDDGAGNLQAEVTKTVVANKEYLVIISFYNPHTMSGSFSITTSK